MKVRRERRWMVHDQRLLTLMDVAEMLRLSPHTIRMMVRKGRLQPVRICRRLLFESTEVARLISEGTSERL
jgi:excisionase family DNA binding protein